MNYVYTEEAADQILQKDLAARETVLYHERNRHQISEQTTRQYLNNVHNYNEQRAYIIRQEVKNYAVLNMRSHGSFVPQSVTRGPDPIYTMKDEVDEFMKSLGEGY